MNELVPLTTRVRSLVALRVAMIGIVLLARVSMPDIVTGNMSELLALSAGYAAFALVFEALRLARRNGGTTLLSVSLLLDGLYLAWVVRTTGGETSILRYLIVLHLIAVILLVSYRTGLKLAAWHTILVFVVHEYQVRGNDQIDPALGRPVAFALAFLLVGFGAATFSAVNERELRRRRADLEALHDFAVALDDARHPNDVAEVLLRHARDVLRFERGLVVASQGGSAEVLAAHPSVSGPAVLGPGSVIERAWSTRRVVLSRRLDPDADGWLIDALGGAERVAVVPMFADGTPAGALVARFPGLSQDRIERRLVSTGEQLSAHAALALRNAWLLMDVEELAVTDSLTRLANRRHLESELDRHLARSDRSGNEVSFLLVDLDRFKALNDTHGHLVGDEVLRVVGSALRGAVREIDTVGRWGGEEFAIVLPDCGVEEAAEAAERIRAAIAAMAGPVPVSASVGVAAYPTDADDRAGLLRAADQALYESKRRGRDRVTLARQHAGGWLDLPWTAAGA